VNWFFCFQYFSLRCRGAVWEYLWLTDETYPCPRISCEMTYCSPNLETLKSQWILNFELGQVLRRLRIPGLVSVMFEWQRASNYSLGMGKQLAITSTWEGSTIPTVLASSTPSLLQEQWDQRELTLPLAAWRSTYIDLTYQPISRIPWWKVTSMYVRSQSICTGEWPHLEVSPSFSRKGQWNGLTHRIDQA